MKKLLSFFSLLAIVVAMSAQTVSLETAQSKAAALLCKTTSAKGGTQSANLTLAYTAKSGNETYYYAFNSPEGGFVIIGGDEAAREVLGYSENGCFDYDKLPENMKWWLSQYTQQISAAIKGVKDGSLVLDKSTAAKGASIMAEKADIPMMIQTIWNQNYPYNSELPDMGAGRGRLVTGCTATAGAQIMKYWNYPTQGMGSKSYTRTWAPPIGTKTFEADFANTTYDWENMCIAYDGNETAEKMKAVGTLMYHVGVAANMIYDFDGSGANEAALARGLIEYFGYDKGMSQKQRSLYSSDEKWEDMIYAELSAGRPILYSGRSNTAGHAFVVDGYRSEDNKFHINWGWGGYCDGYFPLTGTNALTPNGTGIGGGAAGSSYIKDQTVIIGIQPDAGNKLVKSMYCNEYGIGNSSVKEATYQAGSTIELCDFFSNNSLMSADIEVGVRLVNTSTSEETYLVDGIWTDMPMSGGRGPIRVEIPLDFPIGAYYVYPVFKDENDNWKQMDMTAQTIPILTVITPTLSMSCGEYGIGNSRAKNATYNAGTQLELYNFFYNSSFMSADFEVGVKLVNASTSAETYLYGGTWTNLNQNTGKGPIRVEIPADLVIGSYEVYPVFKDENGNWKLMDMPEQTIPILNVTEPSAGLYVLSGPTIADNYNGTSYIGKDTKLHGKVTATLWNNTGSGISNGSIYFYVLNIGGGYPLGDVPVHTGLAAGEKKDVEIDMTEYSGDDLAVGTNYYAKFYYNGYKNPALNFTVVGITNVPYTLTSAGWGTICLPFTADVPSGMTAYEVTGSVGSSLVTNTVSKFEMNKPYLVTGTAGTYNFSGPSSLEGQYTNGLLTGNTASGTVYVPKDSYVLQNLSSGLGFYKVANDNSQTCGQYKAYLTKSPTLSSFPFFLLDGTTGVDDAEAVAEQQGNNTVMKVMVDGKLTIIKDGKAYNAIGIMQSAF